MPTIKEQIEEMKRFNKTFREIQEKDEYWAEPCESLISATREYTKALEALDKLGIKDMQDLKNTKTLDDLDEKTRKAVDNLTFTYVKNANILNKAMALINHEEELDFNGEIPDNTRKTNDDLKKAVGQAVYYCDNVLKNSLMPMDKLIFLSIDNVRDHKNILDNKYSNKRPPRDYIAGSAELDDLIAAETHRSMLAKYSLKQSIIPPVTGFSTCYGQEFTANFIELPEIKDIIADEGSIDDDFNSTEEKVLDVTGAGLETYIPVDDEHLKTATKKIHKATQFMKKTLKNSAASNKEKEYMNAVYIKNMERVEKGYSDTYMMYKTPISGIFHTIGSSINPLVENHKLQNDMKKFANDFPVFDLVVKANEINDTLVDYWESKKKAGGALSPEAEQKERQKLYDKVIATSVIYDKVMSGVEDPEISRKVIEGKILGEDPMHIHPLANRGLKCASAGLDAYKKGLENGWAIDDLAALAAFKMVIETMEGFALGNGAMKASDFESYDPPKWASEETREFVGKMNSLYEEITTNPLTSNEQRKKYLNKMDSIIGEGRDRNLFRVVCNNKTDDLEKYNDSISYYDQISVQRPLRDKLIEENREIAFHPTIDKNRRLDVIEARLNTKRTDLRFSSENKEHKALRESFEELKKFVKENPKKERSHEEMIEYARKLLNRLDDVDRNAEIYVNLKKKASSSGGKERLAGARDCASYAKSQKLLLLKEMKKQGIVEPDANVNDMRKSFAKIVMDNSQQKLESMQVLPTDKKGWNEVYNSAADIIVGRIAAGNGIQGNRVMEEYGVFGLKKLIAGNKEFKKYINDSIKDNTMTGKKLVEELKGDGIIRKIEKITRSIEDKNKKIENEKGPSNQKKVIESNIKRKPILGL